MIPHGDEGAVRPRRRSTPAAVVAALCFGVSAAAGQTPPPVEYHLSFPAPQHRWLAVDVRFDEVGEAPLHVRMSSASPGRYARHEFAKNLIEIAFTGAGGAAVEVVRRGPAHWEVAGHGGEVRGRYRLFGDRIDGTYLAVDATHAGVPAGVARQPAVKPLRRDRKQAPGAAEIGPTDVRRLPQPHAAVQHGDIMGPAGRIRGTLVTGRGVARNQPVT